MSRRQERAAHDLHSRIAWIVKQRVQDPRLRSVTVTGVRPSADLSFVRVFFCSSEAAEDVLPALERAKPFIRRCLAEGLSQRRVPELDFRMDESLDIAARIDDILTEVRRDAPAEPEPEAKEPR